MREPNLCGSLKYNNYENIKMERLHDNFLFSGKRIEKRNPENIDFYFSPGRPGDVRFFYATVYYSEAMYIYY